MVHIVIDANLVVDQNMGGINTVLTALTTMAFRISSISACKLIPTGRGDW